MEAPGFATSQGQFKKLARTRAFLVKLLMGATFDVFIDSSPFFEVPPESTQFVEAFWRRREPVPVTAHRNSPLFRAASPSPPLGSQPLGNDRFRGFMLPGAGGRAHLNRVREPAEVVEGRLSRARLEMRNGGRLKIGPFAEAILG
jgi:hypothetical protein